MHYAVTKSRSDVDASEVSSVAYPIAVTMRQTAVQCAATVKQAEGAIFEVEMENLER